MRHFIPVDLGVNTAATAALGEMPRLFEAGCTLLVAGESGVNEGESTLRKRFELNSSQ